jgi:hypothetical protein
LFFKFVLSEMYKFGRIEANKKKIYVAGMRGFGLWAFVFLPNAIIAPSSWLPLAGLRKRHSATRAAATAIAQHGLLHL